MHTIARIAVALALLTLSLQSPVLAQSRQAPPGMFKDLDDEIVGKAIVLHGKQLFIDNYVIESLSGAKKVLNQPVKHPQNPLVRRDKPWEEGLSSPFGYGAVVRDERDGLYKIWYQIWHDDKDAAGSLGYVTSPDGITWEKPIPDDQPGMDRTDNQLTFSRDGVTWQRVLKDGAISAAELRGERDWKQAAQQATFLPCGEFRKDWDWGQIYPHHPPLVVGDEIRFYYTGITGRHWHTYHNDTRDSGSGLATLRLDGFVSVNAGEEPGIRHNHYLQSYD